MAAATQRLDRLIPRRLMLLPRPSRWTEPDDVRQEVLKRLDQALDRMERDLPIELGGFLFHLTRCVLLNLNEKYHGPHSFADHFVSRGLASADGWTDLPRPGFVAIAAGPGPATQAEINERIERVRRAIMALPPKWRQAIELIDFQELSREDAAATLGVSVRCVFNWREKGKDTIRELLSELG
jgi:RNA polymerase sigma factor (sigma-70 family)